MKIEKKTWPDLFQKILDGEKTFDARLADWECKPGDILVLREYDPETEEYSGREIEKEITFVLKTKDIMYWPKEDVQKYGFQIFSFK